MASTVAETVPRTSARDRVVDALGQAAHVAHDARAFKTLAADAIEDGVHAAKRAVRRGGYEVEALRDAAAFRVKRAPLLSMALAGGAGMLLGIAIGWCGRHARGRAEGNP